MTIAEFESLYTFLNVPLGAGQFGQVGKFKDHSTGRSVAIKIAEVKENRFTLMDEYELVQKLLRENNNKKHPNILFYENCYRIEEKYGKVSDYAILQLCDFNLQKLTNQLSLNGETLSPNQMRVLVGGILKGIKFLHDHKILHRDIKPPNILVNHDKKNDLYIPLIGDFGISDFVHKKTGSYVLSTDIAGDRPYMAPEQIREDGSVDVDANIKMNIDLWSAGVVIYSLFTGETPFADAVQAKQGLKPDQLSHIPKPYNQIIERCLKVDKHQRAQSADELLELLKTSADADKVIEISNISDPKTKVAKAELLLSKTKDPELQTTLREIIDSTKASIALDRFLSNPNDQLLEIFEKNYLGHISKLPEDKHEQYINEKKKLETDKDQSTINKVLATSDLSHRIAKAKEAITQVKNPSTKDILERIIYTAEAKMELDNIMARPTVESITDLENNYAEYLNGLESADSSAFQELKEQTYYKDAIAKDDLAVYEDFIKEFPQSAHRDSIELKIRNLKLKNEEEKAWEDLQNNPSIEKLDDYQRKHLGMIYDSGSQNTKIEQYHQIKEKLYYEKAKEKNTVEAYKAYLKNFPNSLYKNQVLENIEALEPETTKVKGTEIYKGSTDSKGNKSPVKSKKQNQELEKGTVIYPIKGSQDETEEHKEASHRVKPKYKQIGIVAIGLLLVGAIFLWSKSSQDHTMLEDGKVVKKFEDPFADDMVLVKGGTFMMGSDKYPDTQPVHKESLDEFEILNHEVSINEYNEVMGITDSLYSDLPITNITYDEIKAFIKKLNLLTDKNYRLPREKEWEYAARKNQNDPNEVSRNGSARHSVHSGKKGRIGLKNMLGNVREITSDSTYFYDNSSFADEYKNFHIVKGGSQDLESESDAYARYICGSQLDEYIGFRLVE